MEQVVITERRKKGTKILYVAVIVILCLMFAVGFIFGLNRVLAMEGQFKPTTLTEGLTPAPETAEDAVSFLDAVITKALSDKPKTLLSDDFNINSDSIETTFGDKTKETIDFILDGFEDNLDNSFDNVESDFNEDFSSFFNAPGIVADDVENFSCVYYYYECGNCGNRSETPLDSCEACNNPYPYDLKYNDDYAVTFDLKETEDVLNGNYAPRTDEEAVTLLGDALDDVCTVDAIDTKYNDFRLKYNVTRVTDELTSLSYEKDMTLTFTLTFKGAFEALGSGTIKFDVTESVHYNFTWPSLKLDKHEVTVEPKASDNCLATLTCSDPVNTPVTWTSSDENVLTVDEEGYFKGAKEPGEAVVTASFEFNGKTYSDECVVHVRVPVENSKISDRKLTLSAGETHQLITKVGPSKATVKTVTWHTDDESIATVDADGIVTAVAPGTVSVYSLSDDGYYKSSCEVTVK